MKETIVNAAINHDGVTYKGLRHGIIMQDMAQQGVKIDYIPEKEQGFVTNTGRFVNRSEAAKIAFEAGQISGGIYSLDSYQVFPV